MKCFLYKDELYIRAVPGKKLFHSTMVHEVVNRGDIFAIRVSDQQLTIIPGAAEVQHLEMQLQDQVPAVSQHSQHRSVMQQLQAEFSELCRAPSELAELREELAERVWLRQYPKHARVRVVGDPHRNFYIQERYYNSKVLGLARTVFGSIVLEVPATAITFVENFNG